MSQNNRRVYSFRDIQAGIQALKELGCDIPSSFHSMEDMYSEFSPLSDPPISFASLDKYTFQNYYFPGILDASHEQFAPPLRQRPPLSLSDEIEWRGENIHRRYLSSVMRRNLGSPYSIEDLELERNLYDHVSRISRQPGEVLRFGDPAE